MVSQYAINELNTVIDTLDAKINTNRDRIDPKELDYMVYQKIKIQQLIDDLRSKEVYFNHSK